MKLNTLLATLALACTATASFATTTPIFLSGPDDSIHIGASFNSVKAATTDLFTFTVTGPDNKERVDITDSMLVAGSYTLRVLGKVDGSKGGSWGGDVNLVAVPVPEPETYALLAGGLGALGFVARRRRAA